MKLSEPDAELFFDLMRSLQFFVNRKLKILPDIEDYDDYVRCSNESKLAVRNALYKNSRLMDAFVQENPHGFSKEKLAIVSNWKHFIQGDFYIERFLKKYTVFIKSDDVYGVLGLHQAFEEMIHRSYLPLYVRAVLLPYKGKIVYDGIFESYNIRYGGGIKRSLKEVYMRAKQNDGILVSLDTAPEGDRKGTTTKPLKDWTPELTVLADTAEHLRGGAGQPAICTPAFSLVKASIAFAKQSVSDSGDPDPDDLYDLLKKVNRALKTCMTVLNREYGEWM